MIPGSPEPERPLDRRAVDEPRHVRQTRDLFGDRTRNAEADRIDSLRLDVLRAKKLAHHRLEPVVLERDELAYLDRRGRSGPGAKIPSSVLVPPMSPANSIVPL